MDRSNKEALATELKDKFSKAKVTMFADYKGLKSMEADELRRALRAQKTEVKVLKNNIGRLISKDGALGEDAKKLLDATVGPTMIAFSYGDPAASAKVLSTFAKSHEALKIKDSLLDGKLLPSAQVIELGDLPSREILLAKLLSVFNGPIAAFVRLLDAVEKKKGGGAESAPAAPESAPQ
jgi:large subunit ribosomal protein L10